MGSNPIPGSNLKPKTDLNAAMELVRTDKAHGRTFSINTTYDHLVRVLGEPEIYDEPGIKVDAEWQVMDEHTGRTLNVWNYKNGTNYKGGDGMPVENIETWSAGGSRELAEELGLISEE